LLKTNNGTKSIWEEPKAPLLDRSLTDGRGSDGVGEDSESRALTKAKVTRARRAPRVRFPQSSENKLQIFIKLVLTMAMVR
jgi:hypothetical protein